MGIFSSADDEQVYEIGLRNKSNLEMLRESIITDIKDTDFIIQKNKEDFLNFDINPSDYLAMRAQSNGYRLALQTILNRIKDEE